MFGPNPPRRGARTAFWIASKSGHVLVRTHVLRNADFLGSCGDTSGVLKVVVHSPWFREAPTISDRRNHPSPSIESFWEKDGFIWVLLRDADTKWKPPLGSNRERPFDLEDYNRTYDWLLEVIDPESGRVVASKRFPDFLWGRSPSPFLISRRSTGGSVGFDVWKPKVKERSS
jgi:hypothetical protein